MFVALLASTSYIGLLEGSLFDDANAERDALGSPDFNSLVEQSRRLRLGEGTAWKWQVENGKLNSTIDAHTQHLALLTLVFPDSLSKTSPRSMPSIEKVPLNDEALARPLPSMLDPLFPTSQDSTLAFSMPFHKASKFLDLVRELPSEADNQNGILTDSHGATSWAMKARKSSKSASPNTMRRWLSNSWANLVDLIKVFSIYRSKLSHLADESIACGITRYHHNDFWIHIHAFDICFAVHVNETDGITFLACNDGTDLLRFCFSLWYNCDYKAWSRSQYGVAF